MRLRHFLCLSFGVLFGSFAVIPTLTQAQSNASIHGKITDPTGATITGATIAAQALDSNAAIARAQSDPDGNFSLALAPGRYRVAVERASFARVEQEFTLASGETRTWDVRLELATLSSSVIVTDTATPTAAEATPDRVDVITAEDISRSQQIWLAPLLADVPGVSYSRLGPMGGSTTLFLDGGNSNYAKVLIDGVPVNVSEPGLSVDFSNFTMDDIDKVEIVHGAASALYGTDAVSGVVQLFTHRGSTPTPELVIESDGGTFGTGHGSGRLSGLLGLFDYSVGAGYFSSDGQPAPPVDGLAPVNYFRDTTLSGNFGFQISPTDAVRLTIRNDSSDAGQPGQTLFESVPFAVDPGAHSDLHDFSAGVAWNFDAGEHWHNQVMAYDSRFQIFEDTPLFDFTSFNKFNRAGVDGQTTYLFAHGGVTFGYLFESETGGVQGRHDQGGYVEVHDQLTRRLTVVAGSRVEANDSYGTRVVPRTGAAYALRYGRGFWGATRLRASYGEGIKEPPLFPADCTPILKPEQSATIDAGIDQFFASDRVRLSVTYFHNDFHDIVSFASPADPGLWNCPAFFGSYYNTDKARAFGADSSIEIKAARWLRIVGNYSYDNSKVLVSPNATDPALVPGNRLLKRPLNSANLNVNARVRGVNLNVVGDYVGRRTDSDFLGLGITSNPGYFRLDASMIVPLGHGVSTTAHIENLLDRHYQDAVGYPALGYNYRVGVRYVWGGER
jgi:vitamin B12 transporter